MPLTSLRQAAEHDDLRRRVLWSLPSVLAVVGTVGENSDPHLMNVSWLTPVGNDPTRLIVSIEVASKTALNLHGGSPYAISLLAKDDRQLGRSFVKPQLEITRTGPQELVAAHPIARSLEGAPFLCSALSVIAGRATLVPDVALGEHELWLLTVQEIDARDEVLTGPASAHGYDVLTVHDTRMNYGR